MLFAVLPEEVPLFADAVIKERVIAPDGSAAFVLVEASALKDFVSTWRIGRPSPEDDDSPPPTGRRRRRRRADPASARWRLQRQPFAGVALNDFFTPNADHACAWAVNFVSSESERELRVFAGFDDSGEVWVERRRACDCTPPAATRTPRWSTASRHAPPAAGRNTVAVRSCDDIGDWRFYFRLENPDGTPAEGLGWAYGPRRPAGVATAAGPPTPQSRLDRDRFARHVSRPAPPRTG